MDGARLTSATSELPVLIGDRVILRQPVPSDVEARLEVPADPELHRMYGGSGSPEPVTRANAEAMLHNLVTQDLSKARWFIIAARAWPDGGPIEDAAGRYIGHIRLNILSWDDRKTRMAMGIFDRRFWSRGYGSEALCLVLRYGFDDLGLHRIDLRVVEYNERAIRAYQKCGFVVEGIERESALVDGVWYDDVMMSILESEYRARYPAV
jgi:RimJ/RimL family protein N-acetyltransferase